MYIRIIMYNYYWYKLSSGILLAVMYVWNSPIHKLCFQHSLTYITFSSAVTKGILLKLLYYHDVTGDCVHDTCSR